MEITFSQCRDRSHLDNMTRKEYCISKGLMFEGLVDPDKEADPSFIEHADAIEKAMDEFEYHYLEGDSDKYLN